MWSPVGWKYEARELTPGDTFSNSTLQMNKGKKWVERPLPNKLEDICSRFSSETAGIILENILENALLVKNEPRKM